MPSIGKTRALRAQREREERGRNIRAIISERKTRKGVTDIEIAAAINMPLSTYRKRKANPEEMRLGELWEIFSYLDVPAEQRHNVF